MFRSLLTGILLLQASSNPAAQVKPAGSEVVSFPQSARTRVTSPDRKWTLVFECPNDCADKKLWLEDTTSHTRRLVNIYERHLAVSWAPDSRHFFVDDAYASNEAFCFVYDPYTFKMTDLSKLITRDDPSSTEFFDAGHDYLAAKRWLNSHQLLVVLDGHFDQPPSRGFILHYLVDLSGKTKRLSRRIER